MPIPIAALAALPWKKIGTAAAGALVLLFLATPWILWRGAVKDRDVAEAELAVVEQERDLAIASALRAAENRERIESALDAIGTATEALAATSSEALDHATRTGIRARELAAARTEIAELRTAAAELRSRTENLDYCETLEIVVRDLAGGL
jgi:hypothetical protein